MGIRRTSWWECLVISAWLLLQTRAWQVIFEEEGASLPAGTWVERSTFVDALAASQWAVEQYYEGQQPGTDALIDSFLFATDEDFQCYAESIEDQFYLYPCDFLRLNLSILRQSSAHFAVASTPSSWASTLSLPALPQAPTYQRPHSAQSPHSVRADGGLQHWKWVIDNSMFPYPSGAQAYRKLSARIITRVWVHTPQPAQFAAILLAESILAVAVVFAGAYLTLRLLNARLKQELVSLIASAPLPESSFVIEAHSQVPPHPQAQFDSAAPNAELAPSAELSPNAEPAPNAELAPNAYPEDPSSFQAQAPSHPRAQLPPHQPHRHSFRLSKGSGPTGRDRNQVSLLSSGLSFEWVEERENNPFERLLCGNADSPKHNLPERESES